MWLQLLIKNVPSFSPFTTYAFYILIHLTRLHIFLNIALLFKY